MLLDAPPTRPPAVSPAMRSALWAGVVPFIGVLINGPRAIDALDSGHPEARWMARIAALDVVYAIVVILFLVHAAPGAGIEKPAVRPVIGIRLDEKLRVESVVPGGPADEGGLRVGDQLLAVDGRPARDTATASDLLAQPKPHLVRFRRGRGEANAQVTPVRPSRLPSNQGLLDARKADSATKMPWRLLPLWLFAPALFVAFGAFRRDVRAPLILGGITFAVPALLTAVQVGFAATFGVSWLGMVAGQTFAAIIVLGLAVAAWRARRGLGVDEPAGDGRPTGEWLRAGLFVVLALTPRLQVIASYVEGGVRGMFALAPASAIAAGTPTSALLLAALSSVLLIPAAEEVLFRGLAQGWLRRRVPLPAAIAGAAAASALFQLTLGGGLLLPFGVGCALGWLRERSGSLLAPMSAHAGLLAAALLIALSVRAF